MQTSVNYLEGFEQTGTWLYRILEGKDEQHHSDILQKLHGVTDSLERISCEKSWPNAQKQKLSNFRSDLNLMMQEHAKRKVRWS